jgi:hypothetical protein
VPARPPREQPWEPAKELPSLAGWLTPPAPVAHPEQGIGRVVAVGIVIMSIVILWAAWGVASLNNWFG